MNRLSLAISLKFRHGDIIIWNYVTLASIESMSTPRNLFKWGQA